MKTIAKFTVLLLALVQFHTAAAQLIIVNAGNDTTVCAGALITLGGNPTASGGTPPYQYVWSDNQQNSNPTFQPTSTTFFTLTVTDDLGVQAFDTVIIFVNQNPVIDSIVTTDISCFGGNDGSACIYASGGMLPYFYLWENSATGQCIPLDSSTYTFWVTDANGCFLEDSIKVNQPAELTVQLISSTGGIAPDILKLFQF